MYSEVRYPEWPPLCLITFCNSNGMVVMKHTEPQMIYFEIFIAWYAEGTSITKQYHFLDQVAETNLLVIHLKKDNHSSLFPP